MKKRFRVPVKIIFEGHVIVEANSKIEASNNVKNNFNGIIGEIGDSTCQEFIDWDISLHSSKTKVGYITLQKL
jgi:hypothetical protein